MLSSWRRKKASRASSGGGKSKGKPTELVIPSHFRCPISLDMMKDPVTISTGITYDRENIEKWVETGNITCPVTNQVLKTLDVIPNHAIRKMIQDWCVENRSHGVERIPTPRIPISSNEAIELLNKISMAREPLEFQELVGKLVKKIKESERNKKCIIGNGSGHTLSLAFQSYANYGKDESVISVLEDILSGLTLMCPLDQGTISNLKTTRSLDRIVWFLNQGNLSMTKNSILILKEVISSTSKDQMVDLLVEIKGAIEGLFKLVKEPICPSSTKASLVVIYHMITSSSSSSPTIVSKFVEMGLVPLILDILVEANDKSTTEKALGVLDGICRYKVGVEAVFGHALGVPVVVKKILKVSDLATEFSVSVLWRLSENDKREDNRVAIEALQVGAFQKLLLILQIGWNFNERTKEKVSKLLKKLNLYRGRVECIESLDFKDLKRPF